MSGTRKNVLWADDEIEFLRAHIMFLESRGYNVTPVFSGHDAIALIKENTQNFDIVLLDEQMPGKDGLTTLEEIKELMPDLPVVMVTKSEEEHLMEQALGKKIDGYLTKPVNPSQILLVCKRLLESKTFIASELRQQFLRNYSENTTALRGSLEMPQWIKLYENLARWDTELDKSDDEGLRQTHAGQKTDSNTEFSAFIEERYGHWIKGENNPPALSVNVLEKHLYPLLQTGEQVYFVIISGMRLDQYLGIEETVRKLFSVQRSYYLSVLPTDTRFARASLLGGAYPLDIEAAFPDAWDDDGKNEAATGKLEEKLLKNHLSKTGLKLPGGFFYTRMTEMESFRAELAKHGKNRLIVIVADFVDLLTKGSVSSGIAQEIAPDERALRSVTRTWFENSQLHLLLKNLARRKCAVVLTSDHGVIFCTRKTEIYGVRQLEPGLRYKFGKQITADERRVVALNDPRHFKIPRLKKAPLLLIVKDNYYFTQPENYKEHHLEHRNSFQQGGISMEEMIMPFAVFRPL